MQEQFDATAVELDTALAGGNPLPEEGHGDHAGDQPGSPVDVSDVDTVLALAREHGLDGPVEITPAADTGQAWTVAQTDNVWPVRHDKVAVDPSTGTVTDHVRWADQPLLAQLSTLGVQAHMGILFGPANQIVLAATAIGLLCMTVWAYRMWWQRRPTRVDRRRPLGDPPARGTWRKLPPALLVVGFPAVIALGWAIPLLGWSLPGFLVIDLVVGLTVRRRATRMRAAVSGD